MNDCARYSQAISTWAEVDRNCSCIKYVWYCISQSTYFRNIHSEKKLSLSTYQFSIPIASDPKFLLHTARWLFCCLHQAVNSSLPLFTSCSHLSSSLKSWFPKPAPFSWSPGVHSTLIPSFLTVLYYYAGLKISVTTINAEWQHLSFMIYWEDGESKQTNECNIPSSVSTWLPSL